MSPALSEVSSTNGPSPARKARKRREFSNRIVTNLPQDYTWTIREDAKAAGVQPAALARMLIVEAYRARGKTPKQVRAAHAAYVAQSLQAEADEELAGVADEEEMAL